MTLTAYLGALALLLAVGFVSWVAARAWLQWRGPRLVTCPETKETVRVDVAAGKAARAHLAGQHHLELRDCTRWPERRDCGQECLAQVEAAPHDCLVRSILARFYDGRSCVFCNRPFGEIQWHDNKPALMTPDHVTRDWAEIVPETVPELLKTAQPVCWNCHVAETFRRLHPELVTDRPERPHLYS